MSGSSGLSGYSFIALRDCPSLKDAAARWFHSKWGVPEQAYQICMSAYLNGETEYGWEFLCPAHEEGTGKETRVYIHN